MSTAFKRILILSSLFCALFLSFPLAPQVHATNFSNPDYDASVTPDMHAASQGVVIEALNSLSCIIGGYDFIKQSTKCLSVLSTGKLGYANQPSQGIIPIASGLITMMYTPPAHTSDYVHYLSANFIKNKTSAYAQTAGVGFNSLSPLATVWTTFRNITYLLFVVLFVLVGLGITLRFKLDPRTAMTIENSLPKLVIALILVTFSYAIAGLLIDLMYVCTYLVITVMASADPTGIPIPKVVGALNQPPLGFVSVIFGDANGNFGLFTLIGNMSYAVMNTLVSLFKDMFTLTGGLGTFFSILLGFFNFNCWLPKIFSFTGIDMATCGGEAAGFIGGVIMWIVGLIVIFIVLMRVWWMLLKTYVTILLDIILGPFFIALGVLPGSSVSFSSWIRDLIVNLAVFPVVIFIFLLAKIFGDTLTQGNMFAAPLVGNISQADPGLQDVFKGGQAGASYLGYIIAFGLILVTPQLVEEFKTSLKAGKNNYGTALGATLLVGGKGFGTLTKPLWRPAGRNGEGEGLGRKAGYGLLNAITPFTNTRGVSNFGTRFKQGWNQQPTVGRKVIAAIRGRGLKGKTK